MALANKCGRNVRLSCHLLLLLGSVPLLQTSKGNANDKDDEGKFSSFPSTVCRLKYNNLFQSTNATIFICLYMFSFFHVIYLPIEGRLLGLLLKPN